MDSREVLVRFVTGAIYFYLFSEWSRLALGSTQPPVQWVQGVLSSGVKLSESGVDLSPASSTEAKRGWNYIPTPLHRHGLHKDDCNLQLFSITMFYVF